MIRTIIIDDEQHCTDRLSRLIQERGDKRVLLMDTFGSVEDGIAGIKRLRPDLVFLDVRLHDKTGFDLLQQLEEIPFGVIFTTAYEQFAVQAFKFSAIDYLLKPVDPDDLAAALDKLNETIALKEKARKLETLFYNLKGKNKRITVPTITGYNYINVDDIIRCESDVNYTTIYTKDGAKLMVAKTLKEFEELLGGYGFFRVHNSHLINTACIKSYNKGKGGFITLSDDKQVEVSLRRKEAFLDYLQKN